MHDAAGLEMLTGRSPQRDGMGSKAPTVRSRHPAVPSRERIASAADSTCTSASTCSIEASHIDALCTRAIPHHLSYSIITAFLSPSPSAAPSESSTTTPTCRSTD